MTKDESSDSLMVERAIVNAVASAVKIDASFGSLLLVSSRLCIKGTDAAPTAESDFDPSV